VGNSELDQHRLKKGIADKDGVRNADDDILTQKDTDSLSNEDTHEELPDGAED
jgi:hypothetical protein